MKSRREKGGEKLMKAGERERETAKCLAASRSSPITFLQCTGRLGSEQKHFSLPVRKGQDSLRQALLCDYNNKSNEKQVKETIPM